MNNLYLLLELGHVRTRSILLPFALLAFGCGGNDGPANVADLGALLPQDVCEASDVPLLPAAHQLPECTAANTGTHECTRHGAGLECNGVCWAGFVDGPCAPLPDAEIPDAEIADAGVDGSSLPTCTTWGSIYWGAGDGGVSGVGYCTNTGPASDCTATSPDQVLHLCHCTPTDGGASQDLTCE